MSPVVTTVFAFAAVLVNVTFPGQDAPLAIADRLAVEKPLSSEIMLLVTSSREPFSPMKFFEPTVIVTADATAIRSRILIAGTRRREKRLVF
jgi:hypothetical protein